MVFMLTLLSKWLENVFSMGRIEGDYKICHTHKMEGGNSLYFSSMGEGRKRKNEIGLVED